MKQPKVLAPLFSTELWERFGFYIIQGLLIFYLTRHLSFDDAKAYLVLGQYSALIYISPIIGGFLADRILGFRRAVVMGGILLFIGYALLATTIPILLFPSLATIIMGNGLLKPNISSLLGNFYHADDPRRDAGFTLFYMGINIGSLLATGAAGYIQRLWGWDVAFGAAAFGLLLALLSFYAGQRHYGEHGLPVKRHHSDPQWLRILHNNIVLALGLVGFIVLFSVLLASAGIAEIIEFVVGIAVCSVIVWMSKAYPREQRRKLMALLILILFSIVFWILYYQMFMSMNLFVARAVDRTLFGLDNVPAVLFIAFDAIFIILLAYPLARLWRYLEGHRYALSYPAKFALALLIIGLGMAVLLIAIAHPNPDGFVNAYWIVLVFFFIALAEMLISPIGLSMVTRLAPVKMRGLLMGFWFMVIGVSGAIAGVLAREASIPKSMTDINQIKAIYDHGFSIFMIMALIAGVLLFLFVSRIKRLILSDRQ